MNYYLKLSKIVQEGSTPEACFLINRQHPCFFLFVALKHVPLCLFSFINLCSQVMPYLQRPEVISTEIVFFLIYSNNWKAVSGSITIYSFLQFS